MDEQKKISLPEIIVLVMLSGAVDLFEVFSNLMFIVPVIGQVLVLVNLFIGFVILAVIQFWLIMKGGIGFGKQATVLVGNLIELIPFLNILPIRTLTLIIAIYMINNPGIAEKAIGGAVKIIK